MYESPINIIPNHDFNRLTPKELKRLRKELSLQFELKQSTQITINGLAFDKETVLKNLDDLAENGVLHLQIFQHTKLLNFLEKGDLAFFELDLEDFFTKEHSTGFIPFLQPYFSDRLEQLIYQLVTQSDYQNLNKLKKVLAQKTHLPPTYWTNAFTKVHQHLLGTKEKLQQLHEANQLFTTKLGWIVAKKEFFQVFHSTYLKKLALLPYDLDGQLLALVDVLLEIIRKVIRTNTASVIMIDKSFLLDIRDILQFAHVKMKSKTILDLREEIDKVLKSPFYNVLEVGSLFFRSMR